MHMRIVSGLRKLTIMSCGFFCVFDSWVFSRGESSMDISHQMMRIEMVLTKVTQYADSNDDGS